MSLPPALAQRLSLPVVGAPLFIISNPDLVIAQCKSGVVGSFLVVMLSIAVLMALAVFDCQAPEVSWGAGELDDFDSGELKHWAKSIGAVPQKD